MRNEAAFRTYTVSQLARLSRTSVRTLHHYDEIGLLKPASVGDNGYRHYGRAELLRLQQILLHREFGMRLSDIRDLLDRAECDRLSVLREQRERLLAEADRYRRLTLTIDRTIAELEGRDPVMDEQLYEGFSPEKQAEYEAWLIDRYGEPARERIEMGRAAMAAMSPAEQSAWRAEAMAMRADFAKAMADASPDDPSLDPLLKRHFDWVARTWKTPPTAQAYAGLGRLYVENAEFKALYDAARPGLASWMAEAMAAYARRALKD
ncbi:MerR family transcriptional regulator [Brevundimonas sp.]|jgi:DNA-binding transcriptional MerR regulator|uniref:MerR family transcriptional regulator n=1 Tax=Brevundimonas sp. TaxID=1871086 RepID=UPI001AD5C36C|nr:MerR family transcriptional regulator [Brevundimonas sp.]MBN9464649.1 MerR family transcriptional regulator [Brevundimonas sp.]